MKLSPTGAKLAAVAYDLTYSMHLIEWCGIIIGVRTRGGGWVQAAAPSPEFRTIGNFSGNSQQPAANNEKLRYVILQYLLNKKWNSFRPARLNARNLVCLTNYWVGRVG